ARELAQDVRLVIAAQPTRGLDVGSTEAVHQRLLAARTSGSAVLLVSAELDEILTLADRIVVLYRGRIVADLPAASADRSAIGLLMAGGGEPTPGALVRQALFATPSALSERSARAGEERAGRIASATIVSNRFNS